MTNNRALVRRSSGSLNHGTRMAAGFAKREIDIAVSFLDLAALSRVFLLTAILIKHTSPGPVSFVQKRLGLAKRHIHVHKFRTMSRMPKSASKTPNI